MSFQLPDFDTLLELNKTNPEAFEALKQQATEAVIMSADINHQRRLRGLQFQVDMEVRKSKSGMDSCIRISKLMHDKLYDLKAALNSTHHRAPGNQAEFQATVLPFRA